VPGQLVELHERFLVEQLEDPLAGGPLALAVLLVDGALVPGVDGRLQTAPQVGVLARRGVDVDVQALVGRHLGALARRAGRAAVRAALGRLRVAHEVQCSAYAGRGRRRGPQVPSIIGHDRHCSTRYAEPV
jgi:hypothetical protein